MSMRHRIVTVRSYVIVSLVLSDLPSPWDCAVPLLATVIHLVWDDEQDGKHKIAWNLMTPSTVVTVPPSSAHIYSTWGWGMTD